MFLGLVQGTIMAKFYTGVDSRNTPDDLRVFIGWQRSGDMSLR